MGRASSQKRLFTTIKITFHFIDIKITKFCKAYSHLTPKAIQ